MTLSDGMPRTVGWSGLVRAASWSTMIFGRPVEPPEEVAFQYFETT
jgi:hypothetical protein